MNQDETFPGDSWTKSITEFALKRGYTLEQLDAPDNLIEVITAFAKQYGMTPERLSQIVEESLIDEYGMTISELDELNRKAISQGKVIICGEKLKE